MHSGLRQEKNLSTAMVVPPTVPRQFGLRDVTRLLVNTSLGAADLIAGQAPAALSPGNGDLLQVVPRPPGRETTSTRRSSSSACSRWSPTPSACAARSARPGGTSPRSSRWSPR
uniref:hypothetical protein n=1 Tax=Nonomuraea sp. CA-252377 TaxID=3240003 RepID=UPI003F49309D